MSPRFVSWATSWGGGCACRGLASSTPADCLGGTDFPRKGGGDWGLRHKGRLGTVLLRGWRGDPEGHAREAPSQGALPGRQVCPPQPWAGGGSLSCRPSCCFLLIKLKLPATPWGRGSGGAEGLYFPRCRVGLEPRGVKHDPPQVGTPPHQPALRARGPRSPGLHSVSAHLASIQRFMRKIPRRRIKPRHNDADWKLLLSNMKHIKRHYILWDAIPRWRTF